MISVLIAFLISVVYIGLVVWTFGVPPSISDSYYLWEKKKKGLGTLFTFWCWGTGFSILPGWLDMTGESWQFLCFLAAAGLCFVGAAPLFKPKKSTERKVHFGGTIVCVIGTQLWVLIHNPWWLLLWVLFATFMSKKIVKQADEMEEGLDQSPLNTMFWVEIMVLLITFMAIFTQ